MAKRGGPRRGTGKKDKLDSLPEDFRDRVSKMSYEDIDKEIAKITKLSEQNRKNRDEDQDLKQKKEIASQAGEQYKANDKAFRLMQQFCIRVQKDKGRPAGTYDPTDLEGKESVEDVNEAAANG